MRLSTKGVRENIDDGRVNRKWEIGTSRRGVMVSKEGFVSTLHCSLKLCYVREKLIFGTKRKSKINMKTRPTTEGVGIVRGTATLLNVNIYS